MRIALGLVIVVAACSAKLSGSIELDGAKFEVASCKSGAPMGFAGVELADGTDTRLRLVAVPDGSVDAIVFKHSDKGDDLGSCGTLQVHPQNSTINNVTNVEGRVSLTCDGSHKVTGSLEFSNCH
jgi:hypothetical protein